MALFVDLGVERGSPSAVGAFGLAVGDLVTWLGDGGFDPASAQVGAVGSAPVMRVFLVVNPSIRDLATSGANDTPPATSPFNAP
ncbi:hypothetical protein [Saccharothrix sp. NRRL B-16348]|uniref:hypothetical protein n=1 Tax=Saccharothrix sp. NRRL B-16348 TaxID=1415542 RepID=UPI0009EA265D|nr:hypothetical protein [Saccharothrix sp. NRRL B-16348]